MGDAAKGKKYFMQRCAQCHTTEKDGKTKVGPNLFGIYNRKAGEHPHFSYSDSVRNSGITWTDANLNEYIANPKKFLPGAKMVFPGVKTQEERTNVIEYLKTLK